jgi:WD40 repeat protein
LTVETTTKLCNENFTQG